MTKHILSEQEVLAFQLERLYDGEKKFQHALKRLINMTEIFSAKETMSKFAEQCSEARTKLKRIFSYLLVEPYEPTSYTMAGFLKDQKIIFEAVSDPLLRHAAMMTGIYGINRYKIVQYKAAFALSNKLNIDAVSDLLNEIIHGIISCDPILSKQQAMDV